MGRAEEFDYLMASTPWLTMGDFNVVLQMSECSEFSVPSGSWTFRAVLDMLDW